MRERLRHSSMSATYSWSSGYGIARGRSTPGGGGPGRYIPDVGGIGGGGGGPAAYANGARVWGSALRAAEPLTARSSAIAAGAGRQRGRGCGDRRPIGGEAPRRSGGRLAVRWCTRRRCQRELHVLKSFSPVWGLLKWGG
jgi:hypothetical protein